MADKDNTENIIETEEVKIPFAIRAKLFTRRHAKKLAFTLGLAVGGAGMYMLTRDYDVTAEPAVTEVDTIEAEELSES